MAPAGSSNPLPGIIPAALTFAWARSVPVLYLAGDVDRSTPLAGIVEMVGRTPSAARLFVLRGAGHDHFGDEAPVGGPDPLSSQAFTTAMALAHLDRHVRGLPDAAAFLTDAVTHLHRRGVDAFEAAAKPGHLPFS